MAERTRRNHSAAFKAKDRPRGAQRRTDLIELAERFQVYRNQITKRKKQLLERAEEIFSKDREAETGSDIKELHAKIGQLAMENDYLSVALGRIAEPSAKK